MKFLACHVLWVLHRYLTNNYLVQGVFIVVLTMTSKTGLFQLTFSSVSLSSANKLLEKMNNQVKSVKENVQDTITA